MFGRAVYVSQFDGRLPEQCDFYFTSLHIAEEFDDEFAEKAGNMLRLMKAKGKKIIVDMSPRALKALGYDDLRTFVEENGIDYIRFDFGFDSEEIIRASEYCGVAINASTVDVELVEKLKGKVLAIHNFYPRPETGLDIGYFRQKNEELRRRGIQIGAYIAGDENKRGPLHEGLPTLEFHRHLKPYVQYEMLRRETDYVIVGDGGLSERQAELIAAVERDGILRLLCRLDAEHEYLYDRKLTNRPDSPEWLCRVMESRQYATFGKKIAPGNCVERTFGSITVDNEKYLRYSGEIQILKMNLPEDERVNVIGRISDDYLFLLRHLRRGTEFILIRE
ncbi:MAG: DUF871 domain-containing protein [Erysipelotrichaceae bacterium]|nr:DUF871 domain-containing protein [Erysipelotrichaceae bacterium]